MSNRSRTERKGERGFVLTLYTLMMLFVIVPMVGLAIDSGIMYLIKGELQTAVDGAALGAARSLSANVSLSSQESNAGAAGIANYHANFPSGWMGVSSVPDPMVDWTQSSTYTAVVQITGTVAAPTWFMRIFGYNTINVSATGTATRRNLNVMLVIDRSASLWLEQVNGVRNCTTMVADAQDFVNNSFVEGRDQVGLVTFGTSYNYDFPFNTTFKSALTTDLSNINTANCQGFTNAAAGFTTGFNALKNLTNNQFALNVIVFFTDGEPNTMTFGVNGTSPQTSASQNAATPGSNNALPISTSSSCNPHAAGTTVSGVLAGDFAVGVWGGVLQWYNSGINNLTNSDLNPVGTPSGCSFSGSYFGSGDPNEGFKNDITSLPTADAFGDSTTTTWTGGTNGNFPYPVVTTGNWYYMQNLENAGINTLDNAAQKARVAAATAPNPFPYVVYTIGLDPTSTYGSVNQELLRRVANDQTSAVYQSTYSAGKFYYVPDPGALSQAFASIASDILRIAK